MTNKTKSIEIDRKLGDHTLACDGAQREARYRDTKTGRYNGVHLFGPSGTKVYTDSLLNILKRQN